MDYDLEHRISLFGRASVINSMPERFNIDRNKCTFEEKFSVWNTTFQFHWSIFPTKLKSFDPDKNSDVELVINLSGPMWAVLFFGNNVQKSFRNRFAVTNENIDKLIPISKK